MFEKKILTDFNLSGNKIKNTNIDVGNSTTLDGSDSQVTISNNILGLPYITSVQLNKVSGRNDQISVHPVILSPWSTGNICFKYKVTRGYTRLNKCYTSHTFHVSGNVITAPVDLNHFIGRLKSKGDTSNPRTWTSIYDSTNTLFPNKLNQQFRFRDSNSYVAVSGDARKLIASAYYTVICYIDPGVWLGPDGLKHGRDHWRYFGMSSPFRIVFTADLISDTFKDGTPSYIVDNSTEKMFLNLNPSSKRFQGSWV